MQTISDTVLFSLNELECEMDVELYLEDCVSSQGVTFDDLSTVTLVERDIQINPYKLREVNFDRIKEASQAVVHDMSISDLNQIWQDEKDAYNDY